MNKKILGFALGAALTLAPLAAFASTNNVLFDPDGTGSTQVDVNSMVTMHAYVDSSASQELESVFVKFPGANGLAAQGVCYTINPSKIGASPAGGWDISVPVKVPSNAGVWPVSITWYGVNGDGADTTCTGSAVFPAQQFSSRVTVTDVNSTGTQTGNSGGTGSSTGGGVFGFTSFAEFVTALKSAMGIGSSTPPPSISAVCIAYAQANNGTQANVNNDANVRLQGFLLSQGASIPALKAGASFGFYGNQTTAAVGWFNSLNHCQ